MILGVPYYGYDWPTAGPGLGDPATGAPTPLSYAQVMATGGHVYWDPTTLTPWTSYQVGSQWHQAYFDNPTSLALKAQLANTYHIAGVGIWAMGMDGGAAAMLTALRGNAPLVRTLHRGPGASPVTTTTSAPAPAYTYQGSWNGQAVTLSAVDPATIAAEPQQPAGELDRVLHRRSRRIVSGRRPAPGRGLALGRARRLCGAGLSARQLRRGSVGVRPRRRGLVAVSDDDHDHEHPRHDDAGVDHDHLHHRRARALTMREGCARDIRGTAAHTTRVSWPSQ